MTPRRVVALAQALTMTLLLAPGPHPDGPSVARAAVAPVDPEPATGLAFDAVGRGIGCQYDTRPYKGPGLPKDPPWPPGAEPTPSPTPSASPSTDPSADPSASTEPLPDEGDDDTAGTITGLVANTGIRVAQADLETEPTPTTGTKRNKRVPGIDVSHHQKEIDFQKVADAGHRFVLMKATENNDHLDTYFSTYIDQARAAGLAVGAYHFFDYTLDGKVQADHYVDRVEAVAGFDGLLPPIVDVECQPYYGVSIHAVSATRLRDFSERVYRRTGRMPIIYTSVYMWRQVVGNADDFGKNPLWAACWGCDEPISIPPGWDDWVFWQTTISKGVPGIRGRVDGDFFNGRQKDLNALKLRPFAIEGDAVATKGGTVELQLGGRNATHIRTSPDGEDWSAWSRIRSVPTASVPEDEGEHEVHAQFRNGPGLKSPVVRDSITVDRTPPEASPAAISLREGPLGVDASALPVSVRWEARDEVAGLSGATIVSACGDERNRRTEAPGSAAPGERATWDADAQLPPDETCDVTAVSRDGAGNTTRETIEDVSLSFESGAATSVSGEQAGIVARRGPEGGRLAVLLDGEAVGLIDLYAPDPGAPEVVFVVDLDGGEHTLSTQATGSADPASTGLALEIDGIVTLVTGQR